MMLAALIWLYLAGALASWTAIRLANEKHNHVPNVSPWFAGLIIALWPISLPGAALKGTIEAFREERRRCADHSEHPEGNRDEPTDMSDR